MIDIPSILLGMTALANFGLMIFILSDKRKTLTGISFSFFTFFLAAWALSIIVFRDASGYTASLYAIKFSYISAVFLAASYYYFSIVFPENRQPSMVHRAYIVGVSFALSAVLLVPSFLTQMISIGPMGKTVQLNGWEFLVFSTLFLFFFAGGLVRGWEKYRKSSGLPRKQLLFVEVSVAIAGAFGILLNLILPSPFLENFQWIWTGPLFTSLIVGAVMYSIIKLRLFNTKIVAAQIMVLLLWAMVLVRLFLATTLPDQILNGIFFIITIVTGVLLIGSVLKEVDAREQIEQLAEDLELANERLRELDKRKSEFVSIASHQLRSPLTAIKGYSSMMLEGSFGEVKPEMKEAIERIFQSTLRLIMIIEDFLTISRIEQGKLTYNFAPVNMHEVVQNIVQDMQPNVKEKGLELRFVQPERAPDAYDVLADNGKIFQVINNLVDNAIKYTPKGAITVKLARNDEKNRVLVSIADTGVGMNAETKAKLFQKFSRADDAFKVNTKGSGLGLYVAQQIVLAHNGRVWVESPGEGKGSTFFVELPGL